MVVDECPKSWCAYSCTCKQEEGFFRQLMHCYECLGMACRHTAISVSEPPAMHQQQQQKHGLSRMTALKRKTAQHSTAQHSTAQHSTAQRVRAHPMTGSEKASTSRRSCGGTGSHSTTQGRLPPIALACSQATGGTSTSSAAVTPDTELSSDPPLKPTQTVNNCCSNEGRYCKR